MTKSLLLMLGSLSTFGGCASTQARPEQKTVDRVDINRFMGKWYVIAAIPTMFETGAVNAVETYSWNEAEKRIDIDFRFRQDSPTGKEKTIPQTAFIHNHETNAEWRVRPFWPLSFAYLIVDLSPDYSTTIIGRPDRSNVWIMAREPKLSAARYNQLLAKVKSLGYDMDKLVKIPQSW